MGNHAPFKKKRTGVGSALVIVLCFIVLLTALVLAMLTHSLYSGMISRASSSTSKADLYGHGAIEQVLGDLKQEIVGGSLAANTTGGYIYRPLTNMVANAVPYNTGPSSYSASIAAGTTTTYATTIWNTMPNLVKESTRNVPFYPSTYDGIGGPTRATSVNSTTDVSRNGHYISLARWNKPLLLPKATVTLSTTAAGGTTISDSGTGSDLTPTSAFVAPDWILTCADGTNPTPTSLDTSSGTSTSNVNPKSSKFVVGRYAYVIYNEGGLLDANVAGSFGSVTATLSATQKAMLARRGPSAFADMTQLPGIADIATAESQANRSQQIVDSLIAWRNAATVGSGITFFPTFPTAKINSVTSYFNYLLGFSGNFMWTGNSATYTRSGSSQPLSDRVFSSRQQMLSFFLNTVAKPTTSPSELPLMQDAMMYLGTFSRTLNQPSYWPDPGRPRVVGPASNGGSYKISTDLLVPGVGTGTVTATNPYGGGNSTDALGSSPLDDVFNPSFRSVRVTSTFTRNDGTAANVGDPLVYKRFPLSRLMWLTYEGPSNGVALTDPLFQQYMYIYTGSTSGTPPAWLSQLWSEGTVANIHAYFGLTWHKGPGTNGVGGWWSYNNNITSGGIPILGSLSDVAAAGRDPDFFELLKAAVNCGSVGRCLPTNGTTPYIAIQDSTVTPQIFQLGANIIDGANPTQYPTHIIYQFGSADVRSVYGAMDLPYYSAMRPVAIITTPAAPAPATSNDTPVQTGGASPGSTNPGQGAFLEIPSIWDPYDSNGPYVGQGSGLTSSLAPTKMRIALAAQLPTLNQSLTLSSTSWPTPSAPIGNYYWGAYFHNLPASTTSSNYQSTGTNSSADYFEIYNNGTSYSNGFSLNWSTEDSAAIDFNNPTVSVGGTSTVFREPTALLRANVPAGSSVADDPLSMTGTITEAGSNTQFIGFLVTTFPICWSTTLTNGATTTTTNTYTYTTDAIGMFQNPWTVEMEYQPPGTTAWVPYMQFYSVAQYNAFVPVAENGTASAPYLITPNTYTSGSIWMGNVSGGPGGTGGSDNIIPIHQVVGWDPRTSRWGFPSDVLSYPFIDGTCSTTVTSQPALQAYAFTNADGTSAVYGGVFELLNRLLLGYKQQNLWSSPNYPNNTTDFYMDPDATVRRASGAYVSYSSGTTTATTLGLQLAGTVAATTSITGSAAPSPATNQNQSRPIMLHRPYRSVAELGYVFSDTPFRNIDFFTPESGYSALLDVFCINEDYRPDAVAAGRIDLNTKQAPVLQALLAGALRDEEVPTAGTLTPAEAITISQALVKRTTVGGTNPLFPPTGTLTNSNLSGPQPLANIADLVGRWISGTAVGTTYPPTYAPAPSSGASAALPSPAPAPINGAASYDGFSADLSGLYTPGTATAGNTPNGSNYIIQRFREATMRALSDSGQAGTWNLLIDVVAQTGRYPSNATALSDFLVDGERRYWVHVSIDRGTGQIVDENIEPVNE